MFRQIITWDGAIIANLERFNEAHPPGWFRSASQPVSPGTGFSIGLDRAAPPACRYVFSRAIYEGDSPPMIKPLLARR
jgi:hypothetical protein